MARVIDAEETFGGTFPFTPHFTDRAGFRLHYVDEGAGRPLVLLHGEPTWGYLWRHLIGPLSAHHRVVVPDHMGFGKSETPAERTYDAAEHVGNVEALLIDELDLHDVTLVVHDWGGTIGGRFALRHPERVAGLIVVNSVVELDLPGQLANMAEGIAASAWFRWMGAALAGDGRRFEAVLGHLDNTVLHLMYELQGIARPEMITRELVRAYAAPFATTAECRGAMAFPRQIVEGTRSVERPEAAAVAALRAKPAMLVYGQQDRALPAPWFPAVFSEAWPAAPVMALADAGHFSPEDRPDAVLDAIQRFISEA
jgi:pimeloyl-ACP methyl ester carboxylesterase